MDLLRSLMHDALSMVRLSGEVQAVKSRRTLIFVLLCTALCLFLVIFAFASGVETDEDGGTWDYNSGIYTDPTGQKHQITNDDGSSGSSTNNNSSSGGGSGTPMIIDTGEEDPMAGAKKNADGSIEVESGTGGVDIEIEPTRAPLEGEDWQAALDSVAARNGKDTPTVWTDPATGVTVAVEVVYMGIGRSMISVDGQKKLVNTSELKWQTEAPEDKVLAVVRSRYVWLHKSPSNKITVLKFKQVYRDSVVRVLATGKNWTFVDHEGDRAYVVTSALEFYANDHTDTEPGYLSLNGKIKGKGKIQVRDFETAAIIKDASGTVFYQPGTPVTVFDFLDDYAEIDVGGFHCVVKLDCLILERSLAAVPE